MGTQKDHRDKGWAWVVVAGFAVSSFILGGFIKGFGVFFAAFAEKFGASASSTSLMVGVRAAVLTIVAPIATVSCERFSVRKVLLFAGFVTSAGCMAAAFAPNMEVVIVSIGIGIGTGMSAFFGPVQVAIGQYFNKRKTAAMSIAFSGMSFAQIVMSPVIVIFLEEFALQGTLILYSGFFLQTLAVAMLVRPVQVPEEEMEKPEAEISQSAALSIIDLTSVHEFPQNLGSVNLKKVFDEEDSALINSHSSSVDYEPANGEQVENKEDRVNLGKDKSQIPAPKRKLCRRIVAVVARVLDFSLFKNQSFALYLSSQSVAQIGFLLVPIYIFPRAEDCNLQPRESALLLTIMGCTDLLSRILQGVFGDVERVGPKAIFIGGVFCFAISTLSVPFTCEFTEMAVVCGFIGLFSCAVNLVHISNLVNIVGLARLPKALALSSFIAGIINAVSPPSLGYIKDVTSSYDAVFYVMAGTLFLSFSLMMVEPVINWFKKRQFEEDTDINAHE